MVWSPELRAKIGISRASILRKISPAEGAVVLEDIELSPDELKEALSICKQPPSEDTRVTIIDPSRKYWLAAAWLLGASWRQLATLHGVAHSSIMQSARKVLTPACYDYAAAKGRKKIPFERLEVMRRCFLEHRAEFASLDPMQIAEKLDLLAVVED